MSVAPASTYIGQFFSGGVDPSIPHLVLILAAVIGGFAVGIGIIWEAARGGHLWTLPTAFVFFGVIIEATATVILFEFDEGISGSQLETIRDQQSKIIALETRLAPRVISDDEQRQIVELLKPYAGTPFDLKINPSPEAVAFANRVSDTLIKADRKRLPYSGGRIVLGSGESSAGILISGMPLSFETDPSKLPDWNDAMLALGKAFAQFGPKLNAANDGSAAPNAIHVYVGAKE
jgi:hypothetical protein